MITAKDISACLVTRGNCDMQPILDTLPYDDVVIWDNSKRPVDLKVYGRYAAIQESKHDWIYFQDDDVIFTEHDSLIKLVNDSMPYEFHHYGFHFANNAHGSNRAGYDDLALSAAGAIIHKRLPDFAFSSYLRYHPVDHGFLYEADFIFGVLTEFREIKLSYTRLYADDDSHGHLCRQPWQEDLKFEYTNRARAIKDLVGYAY